MAKNSHFWAFDPLNDLVTTWNFEVDVSRCDLQKEGGFPCNSLGLKVFSQKHKSAFSKNKYFTPFPSLDQNNSSAIETNMLELTLREWFWKL